MNNWKKIVGLLAIVVMIGSGNAWAQDHYVQGKVVPVGHVDNLTLHIVATRGRRTTMCRVRLTT